MSNTKKILLSVSIMAAASAALAQTAEDKQDLPQMKKEKCFGIVKAGKNDCAAADGSHSCAGLAKNDGGGQDWVLLPSGTCTRILGGLIEPKA